MPSTSALARYATFAIGIALFTVCLSAPLQAQDETASVTVSVTDTDSGQPLRGAQVQIIGVGVGGVTDSNGTLRLEGLQPGARTIDVRYLGYAPEQSVVILERGRASAVQFQLDLQPISLAEVKVRTMPSVLRSRGFLTRQAGGSGTFITREDIQRMQARQMSDVLRRVAGLTLSTSSSGNRSHARSRGTKVLGPCPIQYFIDGVQTTQFNVDDVKPDDVAGLEVYRGAATVPFEFDKGTAMCGVIVIWTRIN
jgi:outer membrane receptor protein involved in Fe transport